LHTAELEAGIEFLQVRVYRHFICREHRLPVLIRRGTRLVAQSFIAGFGAAAPIVAQVAKWQGQMLSPKSTCAWPGGWAAARKPRAT